MRKGKIERKTGETKITVGITLEGTGKAAVETGLPFLDHMLGAFARHGRFDLEVKATGDLGVDPHHLVEDTGIVLGQAIRKSVGDGKGIRRFGFASVPMDESLAQVSLDCGGRSYLVFTGSFGSPSLGTIPPELFEHFFASLCTHGGLTAHITFTGRSDHHKCEAVFKAFGRALGEAVATVPGEEGVPSTKGVF
ncbi:MAG TPA: imidazoleglycerol-phosphate dehydratase HisB [Methanomicrobiales archaeon]|nr:imidazoleglycerol-phosphate dehydratase HisB [Methanomicrobiales archaeon]